MSEASFGIGVYADTRPARQDIDSFVNRLKDVDRNTKSSARSLDRFERSAKAAGNALKALITAEVLRRGILLADNYNNLRVRISQVVASTTDADEALNKLVKTAGIVGITTEATIDTFQRFTFARDVLNATDEQLLALNLTVGQLGALSGASTAAMSAGLLQLGQALTQPIVRMEEFNSLSENLPALVNEIAIGLGKTGDEIIRMARNGELASRDVFQALLSRGEDVNDMFAELPDTSERAMTELKNIVQRELAEAFDTPAVAGLIRDIADFVDVLPQGIRAGVALVIEGRQDLNTIVEEFFLVDIPKYIQEGFAKGQRDVAIGWVNFTEDLKEQLAKIPLLSDVVDFDPTERERDIARIEAEYTNSITRIADSFGILEGEYQALRDAASENTKIYLDEFFAAMQEVDEGIDDLLNVDRTVKVPRISGEKLREAREEFFGKLGDPAQQLEIEFHEAVRTVGQAIKDYVITQEEATDVILRLNSEHKSNILQTEIDSWQQRIQIALDAQQTLADIQRTEFIAEFGTPVEQVEAEFEHRRNLLLAFAETNELTQQELNERLAQLEEERIIDVVDAEERMWEERFDAARRGLNEYERALQNLADIDHENADLREEAQRELWGTFIDITRSGSGEVQRIGKALAIAEIVRDGIVAVQKAWAAAPFPANLPGVALVTAQTLANVAKVRGGRAFGGTVLENEAYNTGELGAEIFQGSSGRQIFIPPERGTIRPVEFGGVNVQVNVINAPNNTQVDTRRDDSGLQVIDIILEQTENRLAGRVALGDGAIPKALENTYGLTRRGG